MKKIILRYPVIFLLLLQSILLSIGFNKIVFQPNQYLIEGEWDGLKNYFTFVSQIESEDNAKGIFHYSSMNYPYGDYVFFTDNTPLLAIPLTFINRHVVDISSNIFAIHNYFFILSILFSSYLIYYLFSSILIKDKVMWSILLALSLAWISPQFLRLYNGHFNLSLSFIPVLTLLFIRRIYCISLLGKWLDFIITALLLFAFIFIAGMLHFYYIPLIAYPIAIFCFGLFLHQLLSQKRSLFFHYLLIAIGVVGGGLSLYTIVQLIDNYSHLRPESSMGFNWIEWCFRLEAFFHPYSFNSIFPFFKSGLEKVHYESNGFIGNFAFYALVIVGLYSFYMFFKNRGNWRMKIALSWKNPLAFSLLFTFFFSLAMACGSYIKMTFIPISFDNIFFPFYFLKGKVDFITHFRCLARFSWIAWWILIYIIVWLTQRLYEKIAMKNHLLASLYICLLSILLILDMKDVIQYSNGKYKDNFFSSQACSQKFSSLENLIDYNDFQAIYTIPMTQVGSENYDYTINDQTIWTQHWMALCYRSELPTFNCKMSRTALEQTKAHFDVILKGDIPTDMKERLNSKPILVVYSEDAVNSINLGDNISNNVINAQAIIERYDMDTIAILDDVFYLKWTLP
ncbi:MAG: hypothetical protein ACPG4Z_02080 [Chitinophagales bacterium]